MDITNFVVSSREAALLYGDYGTYRRQLSRRLLSYRKKLQIVTKNRGKFQPAKLTADQSFESAEKSLHHAQLLLLAAERAWAHAMSMKASHSTDTKGMNSRTRSHIVSKFEKAARNAESLVEALSRGNLAGSTASDILEARAYAAMISGTADFERRSWESSLKSYSVARIIYSALTTSAKGDIFRELLSETIDPSIRYAAYQAKIPRTQPVPTIARKAFMHADAGLIDEIKGKYPSILEQADLDAQKGFSGAEGAPTTLTWRGREVKIEDAAIAVAWASVTAAKSILTQKLATGGSLLPKDMAAAYDDILRVSQDAVDATKQAIDELKAEGISQSDPRMQSLQITRTAVNFEMISWRIGRNRVLVGKDDGAHAEFGQPPKKRKPEEEEASDQHQNLSPGRQIAHLKEKIVLYAGVLQSIESISELPGVANDQELSDRLEATTHYFTALKCLAIARSHAVANNPVNALALIHWALEELSEASPVLAAQPSPDSKTASPRSLEVTKQDGQVLHNILSGEFHRSRALVEVFSSKKSAPGSSSNASKPLSECLSSYPDGDVNLENIVAYPPRLEAIPVKPLFLDVAWNYISYPEKQAGPRAEKPAAVEQEAKPQKRGWFGFGR